MCSDPCDQAAFFLDREEGGNGCGELQCLALDHPGEEECNSRHVAEAGLQNAVIWLCGRAPRSASLSTRCTKVKSNHKRILMPY